MTRITRLFIVGILFSCFACSSAADDVAKSGGVPPIPTPGTVTMVDLGAHWCVPCKMMEPIIAELQQEYAGRASIIFIDLDKHKDQAQRFGVRGIPTQIFYDREGREAGRNVGFLDKKSIIEMLEKLGVPGEKAL
ncbi:MAG: thioredoxin family protein [Thermodesulfobacteriota bacterium]|nr:thioredoxin family protein [Thermodesulfobacteriota bacterium]